MIPHEYIEELTWHRRWPIYIHVLCVSRVAVWLTETELIIFIAGRTR